VRTRSLIAVTVALAVGMVASSWATRPEAAHDATSAEHAAERGPANAGTRPQATRPSQGGTDTVATVVAPVGTGPQEDLVTYAYATADVLGLSQATLLMAETARILSGLADNGASEALEAEAATLRDQAGAVIRHARAAIARLEPRAPASGLLARVREDALGAYTLTIENAEAGIDLADFAASLDAGLGRDAVNAITALQGGPDLASVYGSVAFGLDAWARANPAAAAQALSLYV